MNPVMLVMLARSSFQRTTRKRHIICSAQTWGALFSDANGVRFDILRCPFSLAYAVFFYMCSYCEIYCKINNLSVFS